MKPNWKSFLTLCLKAHDTDTLAKIFDCFFTMEEKADIADRFAIIDALLEEKMTQRDMSETLGVSIAKITRGSNALKMLDPKLKAFLKKNV